MIKTRQNQVSLERYELIYGRYEKYLDAALDNNKDPVRVFDPLSKKALDELVLIREVSKTLQAQKDEDILKSKRAEEEQLEKSKQEQEGETQEDEKKEEK